MKKVTIKKLIFKNYKLVNEWKKSIDLISIKKKHPESKFYVCIYK